MTGSSSSHFSGQHKGAEEKPIQEHLVKESGKRHVNGELHIQQKENGGGSTRQS